MNRIITIGREFGSGGRELGCRLSEALRFAYYDQEIVTEIAKRTALSEQYVRDIMEHGSFVSFPIHIGRSFSPMPNPVLEQNLSIFQEQSQIIQELAEKSDCVIVGRCADYILRKNNPFRIFVYADQESKVKRCRERLSDGESLSEKELKQKISGVDKKRSRYYTFHTGQTWGDKHNFDLCINTSQIPIKEIVPALAKLFP